MQSHGNDDKVSNHREVSILLSSPSITKYVSQKIDRETHFLMIREALVKPAYSLSSLKIISRNLISQHFWSLTSWLSKNSSYKLAHIRVVIDNTTFINANGFAL